MTEFARCAPWIAAALEHSIGGWTLDDVREGLASGQLTLWPGERSCHVTQFATYPRGKVVEVVASGGDLEELVGVLRPKIETWAKAQGCAAAFVIGRSGWTRAIKNSGYEPLYTVLAKEL